MVLAVITARLNGSTRIKDKVLARVCGRPLLDWIADRLVKCKKVDRIALAIPAQENQYPLEEWAKGYRAARIYVTTGDEDDVIGRVDQAAWENGASKVIRITGDLPFLSYEGIDAMVEALNEETDYLNNVYSSQPWLDGTSAEIAWSDAASRARRLTPYGPGHVMHTGIRVDGTWRSHCFCWMASSPDFRQKFIDGPHEVKGLPGLLVDEPKDLAVANLVMEEVLKSGDDSYARLLEIVRQKKSAIEAIRAG